MEIRKVYKNINPELLFDEIRDYMLQQKLSLGESKLEYYSIASNSSAFTARGTLTFKPENGQKEVLRAHIVGNAVGETKLMVDTDETAFPAEAISAFQRDLDFIFGASEVKRI